MRRTLFSAVLAFSAIAPSTAFALGKPPKVQVQEEPAPLPSCSAANLMVGYTPYYVGCRGAFSGNINGSSSEMTYLGDQFGNTWYFHGKTDTPNAGPFLSNPAGEDVVDGELKFDDKVYGLFVIGIKASNEYSYYLFDAGVTGLTSVPFQTIGTATNKNGKAQGLSHANLYSVDDTPFIYECLPGAPGCGQTTVPEPSTYVLMGSGLLALGVVSRRRRRA